MFKRSHDHPRSHRGPCGARRHSRHRAMHAAMRASGNTAFDAYKEETLRRLEDDQQQFEDFLGRLRAAKDKAEFDQFMDDRATRPDSDGDDTPEETPKAA